MSSSTCSPSIIPTSLDMEDERELEHGGFIPFETKKRIREKEYITDSDTRGHIPVYEFRIGDTGTNKVLVDRETSFVYITGILKALGKIKADVTRLIESQSEITRVLRKIRGGVSAIQGTWLPYEYAKKISQRIAWPIRDELVPVFGPNFPSTCLRPGAPGFGRFTLSEPTRGTRSSESRAQAKSADLAARYNSSVSTIEQARANSRSTSKSAGSEDYTSQTPARTPQSRKSPSLRLPPSSEETVQAFEEDFEKESEVGPFRHRWQGYDHPLPPFQAHQLPTTPSTTYPYSTFDPQISHVLYSSFPQRSTPFELTGSTSSHLPRTVSIQPSFNLQLPVPPSVPYSCDTISHLYHRRHVFESYPFYHQARRGIRLPPRASFSAYSPTSPLPIASLRSTLEKPFIEEEANPPSSFRK
ncbi:hypothetical protein JCM3765_003357 [Sporobolomyces pararoseus]